MPRLLDLTNSNGSPEGLMPQGHAANTTPLRIVPSARRLQRRVH